MIYRVATSFIFVRIYTYYVYIKAASMVKRIKYWAIYKNISFPSWLRRV